MSAKKIFGMLVLLTGFAAVPAMAQPAPGGQPGGTGGAGGTNGGGGGRPDFAQMRQRYEQQIKEKLGASDDEWKALQPRIEKISDLQRQSRGGGGFGRRGGSDTSRTPSTETPSPVQEKMKELQTTLDNKDAKPEEIKAKLAALREARTQSKAELTKAQDQLRELLTARQESVLVTMGVLE